MKTIKALTIVLIVLCLVSILAYGHAMFVSMGEGAVFVQCYYDDGTAAAFADVRVYGPCRKEFASGITDKNGIFAFLPDTAGDWQAVIDDGMGHRVVKDFIIDEDFKTVVHKKTNGIPKFYGVIIGVCLIFGLWGLFALITAKKHN